ncbi:MAG: class I SAM-dependent methyltransferase [Pyrinomonadaceae bacterium]
MAEVVYPGKDLEAMSFAVNYHKWILDEFRPYIGRKVIEVGAGTGDFSTLLLNEKIDELSLVEPSEMFEQLSTNIASESISVGFFHNIFADLAGQFVGTKAPDTIIYINVLEHIEDDAHELRLMYDCLVPGGHALIFVPALPSLYGEFDRQIGHFRRYVKKGLNDLATDAGFKVVKAKYFDFVGIFPWFVKYKILGSASLESGLIKLYDTVAVPVNKVAESIVTPPIGKNLLFVLEKPAD